MVNGVYTEVNHPNIKFGPNVVIHGNNVKINGKYIEPAVILPGITGIPGIDPALMRGAPDVWVNGVNVGNPMGVNPTGVNPSAAGK